MIGVLDLQGGVVEHLDHLERLEVPARRVKTAAELPGLAGLILPGGESTCLGRLLRHHGLDTAIVEAHRRHGLAIWGTCAGAILLAARIAGETPHLGLLDITIRRNAYGSQLDSFIATAAIPELDPDPVPLVFIRAPIITHTGPGVRVLLELTGRIAAVEAGNLLATTFHPELTPSLAFHRHFAALCGLRTGPAPAPAWSPASWTRLAPIP
ncbi:MAG: pyridoxal 5'-phosphate synthase glutaminase subunit PdxT [Lentisphaeria bacterium]|jgi:5'-phosphate synthase pdxT subunit